MEAAACDLPTITTDVPGCRNAIVDKKNWYFGPNKKSNCFGKCNSVFD